MWQHGSTAGAEGCAAAAAGIAPVLFIHSFIHAFIHSLLHSSKLGAGIAVLDPLPVRTRVEEDGTYTLIGD